MNNTSNWLVHDHRKFDDALEMCALTAGAGKWKEAIALFKDFVEDLKLHMRMEDEVLYPAVLEEVKDAADIVADLSDEHDYIALLLRDLVYVIKRNDIDHFEESLKPLHEAMIEHNENEEKLFLNMGNENLLSRRDEIIARLNTMEPAENRRVWDF